jgi:hypothetical protein
LEYNYNFEPGFKEHLVSKAEPFDDYTRELVVCLLCSIRIAVLDVLIMSIFARRSLGTVLVLDFALFSCTRGGCGGAQTLLTSG